MLGLLGVFFLKTTGYPTIQLNWDTIWIWRRPHKATPTSEASHKSQSTFWPTGYNVGLPGPPSQIQ